MAARAKHSCMPGTSEGDHTHVSSTILVSISGEISSVVAKYLGSSTFNPSFMESESRKGKIRSLSMSLAEGLISTIFTGSKNVHI